MRELSESAITAALSTRRLGRPVFFYRQVGSTNDIAHARAAAGALDGMLVVADEQTAGRGRLDRSWWAPPATCLLFSLLLRPPSPGLPLRKAGALTMCLGLGSIEAIEVVAGQRAALKWPNDVVLGGRKLAGMLSEVRAEGAEVDYAVLGMGINVNVDFNAERPAAPAEIRDIATSLLSTTGKPVDRLALLAELLLHTETWYDRVLAGEDLHQAWAARLDTLGRRVRVLLPGRALEGVATRVTPEGGLVVKGDDGALETIWSGDVVTLRPQE